MVACVLARFRSLPTEKWLSLHSAFVCISPEVVVTAEATSSSLAVLPADFRCNPSDFWLRLHGAFACKSLETTAAPEASSALVCMPADFRSSPAAWWMQLHRFATVSSRFSKMPHILSVEIISALRAYEACGRIGIGAAIMSACVLARLPEPSN